MPQAFNNQVKKRVRKVGPDGSQTTTEEFMTPLEGGFQGPPSPETSLPPQPQFTGPPDTQGAITTRPGVVFGEAANARPVPQAAAVPEVGGGIDVGGGGFNFLQAILNGIRAVGNAAGDAGQFVGQQAVNAANAAVLPENAGALGQIAQAIAPNSLGGRLGAVGNRFAQGQLAQQQANAARADRTNELQQLQGFLSQLLGVQQPSISDAAAASQPPGTPGGPAAGTPQANFP